MGTECSPTEPLLSSKEEDHNGFDFMKITLLSVKCFLKLVMWLIFVAWASLIFLLPSEFGSKLNEKLINATSGTVFGIAGSFFLIFSGPLLIIALVAIIYVWISGEEEVQIRKNKPKKASFRLWTFPVIIDGPFGVVTAAELIGIVLFSVYIIWAIAGYTIKNFSLLSLFDISNEAKRYLFLELTGLRFGFIGLICMAFLFLPVARGSVLLRLIDIPFEHAARYHVWLGHLTMALFTLHGLFYVIAWFLEGRLIHELFDWKSVGIANLPGVISLLAGLLMWVTSLPPVRRRINFELFFYTHQLYVVFVVFLAMHVGDFIFSIVAAGIFLFMLDRFLRFFQSRKTVDILSAKCLPSGTVELVISKPQNLQYNALSWVFLQIRELSWLQWHPFSVSSSPLDGKHHLAIFIKVLGDWTEKLRGHTLSEQGEVDGLMQSNLKLKAYVEGPYGHESPYHLTYEHLILVAGGIGISPFLAILSDILHRIRDNMPCLPRNILIVWAIKNSDELPLLHSLELESICPYFYNILNLEIQTYVTRESEPPLEEGKVQKHVCSCVFSTPSKCDNGMSSLVGTGNIGWSGAYVIVPTIGFGFLVALLNVFYINPHNISYWWYKGLLLIICMIASVFLFGGFVIGLWHLWDVQTSAPEISEDSKKNGGFEQFNEYNASKESFVNTIKYGKRPDFTEIFGRMGERLGNVDIGVMVCGPTALQTSIAKECRSMNFKRSSNSNEPIFHFNSHTFDL